MDTHGWCKFCSAPLNTVFLDLGVLPLANSYIKDAKEISLEQCFPLIVCVCSKCLLVQVANPINPSDIFANYAYFSSYSSSWLKHAKHYATRMITEYAISTRQQVIEIGSNDGYLLQFFKQANIPILGIEPAKNIALIAESRGIQTKTTFFSQVCANELAAENIQADLLIVNNVLAHTPDINDFMRGIKTILATNGLVTIEFPHLLQLIINKEFDTIYHEHCFYFSLLALNNITNKFDLKIFNVEEINTHGGSLRVFITHKASNKYTIQPTVQKVFTTEKNIKLDCLNTYKDFEKNAQQVKAQLLDFFNNAKNNNLTISGYGAPAKGNTLLTYCGINKHMLPFTVDKNPEKQSCLLPGTHIPIYSPDKILETQPDYVLILPWNLKNEIMDEMQMIHSWGGKFVIPIPEVRIMQ